MREHNCRSAGEGGLGGSVQHPCRASAGFRRGFIKNDDRRIPENEARQGHLLRLFRCELVPA